MPMCLPRLSNGDAIPEPLMTDKPLKDDLLDDLPEPKAAATEPTPPAERSAPESGSRIGLWLSGISLVLAVGLMGGGIWLWVQYQTLLDKQQAVAMQSSESLRSLGENLEGLTSRIDGEVVARVETLRSEQVAMEQSQNRLRDSVNEVKALAVGDRKPLVLADTEYLLKLANERLTFMFDTETSVTALQSADAGLASLEDPDLIEIRAQIAREIDALRAVPSPDIAGMAVRLAALGDRVDELPLPGREALRGADEAAPAATGNADRAHDRDWREAADKVMNDLRKLVVVRHRTRDQHEVLTPRESYFLRENLRLKLESARLSLLQREGDGYRGDLATARGWVERYFVADSNEVRHMLASIDELAAQPIEVERPNITASLRQVRLLRARLLGEEAGRAKAAAERAEASVPAAAIEPASMEPAR